MRMFVLLLAVLSLALAQSKPPGAGHWEGSVQAPDAELKMMVDLAQNEKGEWIGSMDLPDRRLDGATLTNITVKGATVSFSLGVGSANAPSFQGQLSQDGKELKGEFSTPGGSAPANLKWTAEPKVKLPSKSGAIGKEFEGTWEGKLTVPNGMELRLRVKLANGAEGATGTLDSLDQGAENLPLSGIVQNGTNLKFELKMAGGSFNGDLKDGALVGEWTQGGGTLPLTLKKAAAEQKK